MKTFKRLSEGSLFYLVIAERSFNRKVRKEKDAEVAKVMDENELSNIALGLALKVHKRLGPGLLESAYEECLSYELSKANLNVQRQRGLPLVYDEVRMDCGYRVDLLVEGKLIIEIKSVESLNDIHLAQILTYLKLPGCKLGLLINFNVSLLKTGVKRVVNHL